MPRETVISLGRRLPGASSGLTRERHAGRASPGRETGIALLFGLAPGGVYRAGAVARAAGELLPHRFTLTVALPRRRFTFCGTGPWGCPPWRLASTLPCGARTFLPRELPHAGDHPAFSGANQRAWGSEESIALGLTSHPSRPTASRCRAGAPGNQDATAGGRRWRCGPWGRRGARCSLRR
jgi:hypothetical protein